MSAPNVWNSLPNDIRNASLLSTFRARLISPHGIVVNKDLSFKAKAMGLDVRTLSRTALDYGVQENIKLEKGNSITAAQVHAMNTLLNSVKGSKPSKLSSCQSHGALTAFMSWFVWL